MLWKPSWWPKAFLHWALFPYMVHRGGVVHSLEISTSIYGMKQKFVSMIAPDKKDKRRRQHLGTCLVPYLQTRKSLLRKS